METADVLRDIAVILYVGLIAQPLAEVLRLPRMVLLLAAGILLGGDALDVLDVPFESLGAQLLFTLGVSLILFHGGVGISLRVIRQTAVGLGMLVLPGVMLTAAGLAVVIAPLFDVPFEVALLVGAVLAATDPAILIPLFDRLGLRPKIAQTVIAESAFNDPTATVLALAIAGVVASGDLSPGGPAFDFLRELALGAVFGLGAGVVLAMMISSHRFGIWSEYPAAVVLSVVAAAVVATGELEGSAYLAAFVMGLVVGNADLLGIRRDEQHFAGFEHFVVQVSDIAVVGVFVVLGLNLDLGRLWDDLLPGLVVMAAFLLVIRPLVVLICLGVDRPGRWTRQEIVFLSWCRETGVVPAAIASLLVADGIEGGELAVSLVALAVLTTLLLQATTAGALARRLGLVSAASTSASAGRAPGTAPDVRST